MIGLVDLFPSISNLVLLIDSFGSSLLNHSNPNNFLGPQFAPIQPVLELPENSLLQPFISVRHFRTQKISLDLLSNLFNCRQSRFH